MKRKKTLRSRGRIGRGIIVLLVISSALLLPFFAYQAKLSYQTMKATAKKVATAEREAVELARLRQDFAQYEMFQDRGRSLLNKAISHRLTKDDWYIYAVDVERRQLTRREAVKFISGTLQKPGYLFVPESFTLQTVGAGDNLFDFKRGDVDRLLIALSGTYYSQGSH